MRKLLPILLALLGIGGGVAAGFLNAPAEEHETKVQDNCVPTGDAKEIATVDDEDAHGTELVDHEYFKFNNQFVVPVISEGRIGSLVVLTLSIELVEGQTEDVYLREPKLRDRMLEVLFDHANFGGFDGPFTDTSKLAPLRRQLLDTARSVIGDGATDVLITEIARQDNT